MTTPLSLEGVNALTVDAFIAAFGDVVEHSPWVAQIAAGLRPFRDRAAMIEAFAAALALADADAKLAVLRAHPDLAGLTAVAGELTADSTAEQKGAGLDQLTAAEFARFTDLNGRYVARFGFPFIFAVRGATKGMILDAFTARVDRDRETEFAMAVAQVMRIIRFRLEDRVAP